MALQSVFAWVALSYPSAFGYGGKILVFDDVRIYHEYARPILEGRLPYRDYPVEYPILAIPFFVVPLVCGSSFEIYRFAFAAQMLAINAAAAWLVARSVEESEGLSQVAGRLGWYSAFFAVLCPMIVVRYDLAPMWLAFASARWLGSGRAIAGGVAAGLGALVKLVPGLVLVPFLAGAASKPSKARGLGACGLTVALGAMGWWWLGGEQVARSFRYHGERGLEIGSLAASAYLVAHHLAGVWVFSHFDHGSMNLSGPGSHDAASLSPILQGALLVLVASRSREAGAGHASRFAAAALLAYILPGKVLSPQYLVWLLPFVCSVEGARGLAARRVFLVACLLTTMLYPHMFHALSYFEPLPVAVLATRNLSLAGLFLILIGRTSVHPAREPDGCLESPGPITPTRSCRGACS